MADAKTTVQELSQDVYRFVAEREWEPYHDPKNLAMSIAIEAAELMEHFQWVRSEQLAAVVDDPRIRGEIADEVADIACYLLSLSRVLKLDLATAVREKLVKNAAKYPVEKFRGQYYKPGAER